MAQSHYVERRLPFKEVHIVFFLLLVVFSQISGCSLLEKRNQLSQLGALEKTAAAGNITAQLQLAGEYERGDIVPVDIGSAIKWYETAARQGSAEGAFRAAVLLLQHTPNRSSDALLLLEQASEAGYASAQLKLGDILAANSSNEPGDLQRVFNLYLSAAKQGLRDAQFKVAELLVSGRGVEQDLRSALLWYRRAAEQNDKRAQLAVGNFYLRGVTLPANVERALAWYKRSAEQGVTQAQANMGDLLTMDRYSTVRNYEEGIRWYEKAASNGHAHAGARLGRLYEGGEGTERDIILAAKWYRSSAELGNSSAQCRLGSLYFRGLGVPQDNREAERWFELAAAQVPAGVTVLLGFVYYDCDQFDATTISLLNVE